MLIQSRSRGRLNGPQARGDTRPSGNSLIDWCQKFQKKGAVEADSQHEVLEQDDCWNLLVVKSVNGHPVTNYSRRSKPTSG